MLRKLAHLSLLLTSILWANLAGAQPDDCSDALRNGTFSSLTARGQRQLLTAAFSDLRMANSSAEKSSTALGLTVPIEGVPLDGNFSAERRKAMHNALSRQEFSFLSDATTWQYAKSSGDPVIIDGWLACMRLRGGGLAAWFEIQDATTYFLRLRFVPPGGAQRDPPTFTLLDKDVEIPAPFSIEGSRECINKGMRIDQGGCFAKVTLDLKNLTEDQQLSRLKQLLTVFVSGEFNTDVARLPPRVKVVLEPRENVQDNFTAGVRPRQNAQSSVSTIYKLSAEDIAAGWVIDPTSFKATAASIDHAPQGRPDLLRCASLRALGINSSQISLEARPDNNSPGDSGTCRYPFSYSMFRFVVESI